jgi:hypothetical protein
MLLSFRTLPPFLVLAPALLAQAPQTPTVDSILARHFEARGGLARIRALQTLVYTGRIEVGPMTLGLRLEFRRGAFRSDTSLQGLTKTEAFDGRGGWILDPFAGATKAEPMSPAQLRQAELQADFDGPLVDWQARGHQVVLAGMAAVNGAPAYVLNVRLKNGDAMSSFIDAKTFMEVKAVNQAVTEGRTVQVETLLGDYRVVNGVQLPFRLDIRVQGQTQSMRIVLERAEANVPLDETRFRQPAPPSAGAPR